METSFTQRLLLSEKELRQYSFHGLSQAIIFVHGFCPGKQNFHEL
jgi:hypothetical protein